MSKDKTKDKVRKSDSELRALHAARVEHAVQGIEKWTAKLGKAMTSKKYPLTEERTAQVLGYLEKVNQSFVDALTAPAKIEKPTFKLK